MLHSLKGRLIEKSPVHAVIDCNGVAYHLNISLYTFGKLPDNEQCTLYTHLHTNSNDFSFVLYGFVDQSERELFRKLVSVSGVGPNTARMVLSSMGPGELVSVIMSRDVASLKRIKGIGEKTAERILIDLHDKISKGSDLLTEKMPSTHNTLKQEALAALASLGLEKAKTEKLLDKLVLQLGEQITLEELVRQVLKQL